MPIEDYHASIFIDSAQASDWEELTNFKAYPCWCPIEGRLDGEMKSGYKIATFKVLLGKKFYP